MNSIDLSIIVPIYNVSAYIERCAHSLMSQTLEYGIEFLFIDDCSTDDSVMKLLNVLKSFPVRKSQVRLFAMDKNSGQAAVRTKGIRESRGQYIIHCDSDDWVEPEMYESLLRKAIETDADIVSSSYYLHKEADTQIVFEPFLESDGKTVISNVWKTPCLSVSLWNKVIRRSLFVDNNLFPFEGINIGEDSGLIYRVLYFTRKIVCLPQTFYHYDLTRQCSISHQNKARRWKDANKVISLVDDFYRNKHDYDRFKLGLNFLKFQFKTDFIFEKTNLREWREKFPEVNRDIIRFSIIPLKTRLIYLYYCYAKVLVSP